MPEIPTPLLNVPIVDENGIVTAEFQQWINRMTRLDIIVGAGSPEGSIEATVGRLYMDDTGTSGSILYAKRDADDGAGDKSKGWILV